MWLTLSTSGRGARALAEVPERADGGDEAEHEAGRALDHAGRRGGRGLQGARRAGVTVAEAVRGSIRRRAGAGHEQLGQATDHRQGREEHQTEELHHGSPG